MSALDKLLAQRNSALIEMDMDWARKMMPLASSDEVRMVSMHKARYEVPDIPKEMRHSSRHWLESRGYGRLCGLPWPQNDELPE